MTPSDTAKQLRLAADILETGHPWECKHHNHPHPWQKPWLLPQDHVAHNYEIRLILATPPDGRPLHNPHCLTAEQVGVGYRLLLEAEIDGEWHGDCEFLPTYDQDNWRSGRWRWDNTSSIRLPLSVPWPEAKPEAPPFQLPPPPPNMRWHRTDGWQEGDLPQGWRPLVDGEFIQCGDEVRNGYLDAGRFIKSLDSIGSVAGTTQCEQLCRTRRPLTFTHAGKTWTWHRPGDPMPCDGNAKVEVLLEDTTASILIDRGSSWAWSKGGCGDDIIGWRYADEKKTVPLGPEDVPPGSVFHYKEWPEFCWKAVHEIDEMAVYFNRNREESLKCSMLTFKVMMDEGWQINRSIPLTGRWDANAWEPCSKEITV